MDWSEIEPKLRHAFLDQGTPAAVSDFVPQVRRIIRKKKFILASARRFGTPQYFLDEETLTRQARRFKQAFKKHVKRIGFFYAFKCNDLPYLVDSIRRLGFDADVASGFELKLALRLGFKRIIFTGPGKSQEELRLAIKHHNKVIVNIDNFDELDRLIGLKAKMKVSFRITPARSRWSKFGIPVTDLRRAADKATKAGLVFSGIHFHSSWNSNSESYTENIASIANCLKTFDSNELKDLEFLDIGGGFLPEGSASYLCNTPKGHVLSAAGIEYDKRLICNDQTSTIETIAKDISSVLRVHPLSHLELWVEPGRYLVSSATMIVSKVVCKKDSSLIADAGINMIGGANADFEFFPIVNLSKPSLSLHKTVVYGPLCDPDDLWGYYYFGDSLRKGDVFAVANQGSYTFSTSWRFIRPTPKYIILKKGRLILAKAEESLSSRYSGCAFPKGKVY